MKFLLSILVVFSCLAASLGAQGNPEPSIRDLGFLVGTWQGKGVVGSGKTTNEFVITLRVTPALGGRYLEERSTTLVAQKGVAETLHLLSYDPALRAYRSWWFDEGSAEPRIMQGTYFDGKKLQVSSYAENNAQGVATMYRATYERKSDTELAYSVEYKQGDTWTTSYKIAYTKKT
jgi:hypothetical protein